MIMYVMLPTMELIIKGDQFLQICQAIHNQCSISAIMTATAFQKKKKKDCPATQCCIFSRFTRWFAQMSHMSYFSLYYRRYECVIFGYYTDTGPLPLFLVVYAV